MEAEEEEEDAMFSIELAVDEEDSDPPPKKKGNILKRLSELLEDCLAIEGGGTSQGLQEENAEEDEEEEENKGCCWRSELESGENKEEFANCRGNRSISECAFIESEEQGATPRINASHSLAYCSYRTSMRASEEKASSSTMERTRCMSQEICLAHEGFSGA